MERHGVGAVMHDGASTRLRLKLKEGCLRRELPFLHQLSSELLIFARETSTMLENRRAWNVGRKPFANISSRAVSPACAAPLAAS